MKTTIDIPEELMAEVMEFSGAQTKKEAVIIAIEDFIRHKELQNLRKRLEEQPFDLPNNEKIEQSESEEFAQMQKAWAEINPCK